MPPFDINGGRPASKFCVLRRPWSITLAMHLRMDSRGAFPIYRMGSYLRRVFAGERIATGDRPSSKRALLTGMPYVGRIAPHWGHAHVPIFALGTA